MSEAILADLQRRLNNLVTSGVVHSVQAKPLRCRVQIGDLLTDWLRCHMPAAGDVNEARLPVKGEAVQVFSESGDLRNGVVYPGLHNDDNPSPVSEPGVHTTRYADGTYFTYDINTKAFGISLLDGAVSLTATPDGWVFKGKVIFEDETTHKDAVICEKTLAAKGDISTQAELSDSHGSLSGVRETYNEHDHEETDSTTRKPNQLM